MKVTPWDRIVLTAVGFVRTYKVATTGQIADTLEGGSKIHQRVFASLDNLETAGYLESALVKANSVEGDVRCWMLTEKAAQYLNAGG